MGTHPIFESDFDCLTVFCFRARESDECFSAFGGFVSPRGNYNPFTQNLENKELCRNLRKNSSHVCTRFYHKILGSFCTLRLTLQYSYEGHLHCIVYRNLLPYFLQV